MTDAELGAAINAKYGRFFGEFYETITDVEKDCDAHGGHENCFYICEVWEEFGVTLVEMMVDVMCNELVVVRTPLTKEEKEDYAEA